MGVKFVGARVTRREDPHILMGKARYVDDVILPGMLHAAILRSMHAHARIRHIETAAARALPDVIAVITSADLGPNIPAIPVLLGHPDLKPAPQHPLATDVVRYVGDPIAVVVATTRQAAEAALDAIRVEYEPLPALVDPERALQAGQRLHEHVPNNTVCQYHMQTGDPDEAFRWADLIVRERLRVQRHTGVPLETRGIVADYDERSGILTAWMSTQWPHTERTLLTMLLHLPEHQIRVIAPDVGGGFGPKAEFYPEDFLIPFLAYRLRRPIKWIEDRWEHFQGLAHSRDQIHEVEIAVKQDGTILGLKDRLIADMGAYVRTLGIVCPSLTAATLPGPYRIRNYATDVFCVLTNKVPVGAYRGAGQPEATFVRERIVDIVARRLGLDPAAVRLKNFIRTEEMPYAVGTECVEGPIVYDSGDYTTALQRALQLADYEGLRRQQAALRQQGRFFGLGIACYAQISGLGPYESASIRIDATGKILVITGASPHGQGTATTLAQICADELGVDLDDITVLHGDTGLIPYGVGTYASRNAVVGGNAVSGAAHKVREKILQLASHLLEANVDDLEIERGNVFVRGSPHKAISFAALAAAAAPGQPLPEGMTPGLEATHYFEVHQSTFSYAAHIAFVEVDPALGTVQPLKYFVVNDAGRLINPQIVEGQIIGGIAQGIGAALLEDLIYDEQGQLLTTTFMDYLLPQMTEMPEVQIEHMETPSPLNPLGIKGLGEGGAIAAHAAIANAVEDALAPFGVTVTETPLSPDRVTSLVGPQGPSAWRPAGPVGS
jgi:carbon-monoxide dehydrogenase large subunit